MFEAPLGNTLKLVNAGLIFRYSEHTGPKVVIREESFYIEDKDIDKSNGPPLNRSIILSSCI